MQPNRYCDDWEHGQDTVPYHDDIPWHWRLRFWIRNRLWDLARAVAP